jgi:flagellar biosynthesis/type III secretory pathway M-ring protein FliF/YscJ
MVVVPVIKSESSPTDFLPFALFAVGVVAAGLIVVRKVRKRARKEALKESPKPSEEREKEEVEEEAIVSAPSRSEEDYYSDWGDGKW